MKRFYFNIENDHSEIENDHSEHDSEGIELANLDQARREALILLGEMIRDVYGPSDLERQSLQSVGE